MLWATIVAIPAPLRMRRAKEEQRCDRVDAIRSVSFWAPELSEVSPCRGAVIVTSFSLR